MASGSFNLTRTGSTSSYITFKCEWTSTPNSGANTSTVKVVISASKSSSSTADTYGNYTANAKVDGNTQSVASTSFRLSPGKTITLLTKTFTVTHNANGTKSVTITGTVGGNVMTATGSATVTLDTINTSPGAVSSFTISAGNGNYVGLGDTVTLKWSAASGNVTGYELQYSYGNSGWQAWKTVTGTSTSVSFGGRTDINQTGAGKIIKYRIRALNGSLASAWKESNQLIMSGGVDIKVNGSWKQGTVWINVKGAWKRAKRVYFKNNNSWNQSK